MSAHTTPTSKSFQTYDDVKTYLSGDKIQCLICGKMCRSVGNHAQRAHGVYADDYRKMFGIPRSYGLACAEVSHLRSVLAIDTNLQAQLKKIKKGDAAWNKGKSRGARLRMVQTDDMIARRKETLRGTHESMRPVDSDGSPMLSPREAAKMMGVAYGRLMCLRKRGKINPTVITGRYIWFSETDIKRQWVERFGC